MASRGEEDEWAKDKTIAYISQELRLLQKFCQNNKLTHCQTVNAAKPFLRHNRSYRSILTWFVVCGSLVGLLSALIYIDPVYRFVRSTGRKAAISVLPVVDWTRLHEARCLLPNPLNNEDGQFDPDNCKTCSNLTDVPSLFDASMEMVAERYLNKGIPVVVHAREPTSDLMSMSDLIKVYTEDDLLRMYVCCDFDSNIYLPKGDHRVFLRGVRDGVHKYFYAFWQNCFKDAARMFRSVYQRPDFLPSSVELGASNWVFMSTRYAGNFSLPLPLQDSVTVLIQMSGCTDLVLTPVKECKSLCKPLSTRLKPGSVLILGDLLYDIDYIPSEGEPAITIGIGGSLDT